MYEASYDVGVGASPVFLLGVDLDHDHILRSDKTFTAAEGCSIFRPVKLEPVFPHQVEKTIDSGMKLAWSR